MRIWSGIAALFFVLSAPCTEAKGTGWVQIVPGEIVLEETGAQTFQTDLQVLSESYITDISDLQRLDIFAIQKTEVSCAQFLSQTMTIEGKRKRQIELRCEYYPDEPVVGLTQREAKQYCEAVGAELPAEAQWMAAALYKSVPESFNSGRLSDDEELTDYIVDVADADKSPSGLIGMKGNVWEMTVSRWGNHSANYIMKGGAFDLVSKPYLLNPLFKAAYKPDDVLSRNVGFRCVK